MVSPGFELKSARRGCVWLGPCGVAGSAAHRGGVGTQKSRSPAGLRPPGPALGLLRLPDRMTRPIALCPLLGAARAYTSQLAEQSRSWADDTEPADAMSTISVGVVLCPAPTARQNEDLLRVAHPAVDPRRSDRKRSLHMNDAAVGRASPLDPNGAMASRPTDLGLAVAEAPLRLIHGIYSRIDRLCRAKREAVERHALG